MNSKEGKTLSYIMSAYCHMGLRDQHFQDYGTSTFERKPNMSVTNDLGEMKFCMIYIDSQSRMMLIFNWMSQLGRFK